MAANFIYQSKTLEERIQNATKAFENYLNNELRNMGSKYYIEFSEEIVPSVSMEILDKDNNFML